MTDIDQSRFALMTVLTRAHEERPDDYADPGLLHSLEAAPRSDAVATRLQRELRRILDETP
jgi:hypothetical protein